MRLYARRGSNDRVEFPSSGPGVQETGCGTKRIARRYVHKAPRIVREGENDYFVCEGAMPPKAGLGTASSATDPAEAVSLDSKWDAVFKGAWDPEARLAHMDGDGIEAEIIYTSLGFFLFTLDDLGFQLAAMQAYNEWLADFCFQAPGRLFGVGLVPVEAALPEMRHVREKGFRAAMISTRPAAGKERSRAAPHRADE